MGRRGRRRSAQRTRSAGVELASGTSPQVAPRPLVAAVGRPPPRAATRVYWSALRVFAGVRSQLRTMADVTSCTRQGHGCRRRFKTNIPCHRRDPAASARAARVPCAHRHSAPSSTGRGDQRAEQGRRTEKSTYCLDVDVKPQSRARRSSSARELEGAFRVVLDGDRPSPGCQCAGRAPRAGTRTPLRPLEHFSQYRRIFQSAARWTAVGWVDLAGKVCRRGEK